MSKDDWRMVHGSIATGCASLLKLIATATPADERIGIEDWGQDFGR